MSTYTIRLCNVNDAAIIARHRVEMFRDMGGVPTDALAEQLLDESTRAIADEIGRGAYLGWFAVTEAGEVIAGVGAHVKPQLPRISHGGTRVSSSDVPLVVNVYTERTWRKKGIARALMSALMQWAKENGFDRVVLHASDAGRPLYTSIGFAPTNEMRWTPPAPPGAA